MAVKILNKVRDEILETVGYFPAESGGVLARDTQGVLVDFYFDCGAGIGKRSYIPTLNAINQQVNRQWHPLGCHFAGLVHSHPSHTNGKPSAEDIKMAQRIICRNHLSDMLLIIVYRKTLLTWNAYPDGSVVQCDLIFA